MIRSRTCRAPIPLASFTARYGGEVLQFARQEAPAAEQDGTQKPGVVAFFWFVPELHKNKCLWRDVLLASLVIQLLGLAKPLFTQVIIDRVVVLQSQSTLVVLGVALVMSILLSTSMTWLGQGRLRP